MDDTQAPTVDGVSFGSRPKAGPGVPLKLRLASADRTLLITQADALVGRHSHAEVRLEHPDVSRRHARLFFDIDVWKIRDLYSLNGVYVNGERVYQSALHQGDIVRIGGTILVVDSATLACPRRTGMLRSIVEALPGERG